VITFPRYFRPSAIATVTTVAGTVLTVKDLNLPPPAPRGPRIVFRVTKTLMSDPDEADVAIYNLSPVRERLVTDAFSELGRSRVLLFGGYGSTTARLFGGDVRSMQAHRREGPDYALVMSADDAGDSLAELTVSYGTAGLTADNMIDIAIAAINTGDPTRGVAPYPLARHPSVATVVAAAGPAAAGNPFSGVHAGKVTELFDEAARILKARWWIADGLFYMAARKLPTDGLAIVLRSTQWLSEPQDDANGVMKVAVLFDPNLVPGRQVQLVDQRAQLRFIEPTPYRVEAVTHSGDTRSGPWSSELVLRRFP